MTFEDLIALFDERLRGRFFGKYEGVVTKTDDPLDLGRVRAKVPAVLGADVECGWALPSAAFGGSNSGMLFVPEKDDTVWIEFAAGDVNRPIYSGAFWSAPSDSEEKGESEVPTNEDKKAGPQHHVLRTRAGHRLVFDDAGEIVILAHGDDKSEIRLTKDGEVIIKAGTIKLGADAGESLVLGNTFKDFFNQHTHPTGVGPSGTPTQPMGDTELSSVSSTE